MKPIKAIVYNILFFATRTKKNYFSKLHFYRQTNTNKAAFLFKKSVRYVEIEISSYCNRVCTYCPNALVDRRSEKNYIDDNTFENILNALSRIRYNKVIRLNRYNEPLENRDYYLKRMRQVKSILPHAKFEVYTNGDYLNHDYVETLRKLGCRRIHATAHVNWKTYSPDKAKEYLLKLVEKLGFDYSVKEDTPKSVVCEIHAGKNLHFTYQILDFMAENHEGNPLANDRGQSLDIPSGYKRTSPCLRQFEEVSIDYTGTLIPCCHIRPDVPGNEKYALGKIGGNDDLFLLWCNEKYVQWRRSMVNFEIKGPPCTTCDYITHKKNKTLLQWDTYIRENI